MSEHNHGGAKPRGIGGFLSRLFWGTPSGEEAGPPAVQPRELSPLLPTDGTHEYRDDDTIDAETLGEVLAQIEAGRKIEAIKLYRQAAGVGLKESKQAVERLAQRRAA